MKSRMREIRTYGSVRGLKNSLLDHWDVWEKEGKKITSCTIITTSPNKILKPIHDRMPVILNKDEEKEWLKEEEVEKVVKLLHPYQDDKLKAYAISTLVNSPTNNRPEILEPV